MPVRRLKYIVVLALAFVAFACKHEIKFRAGGTMSFAGTSYAVSAVRIDHIGYQENRCQMRFTATPFTYTLNETKSSGSGLVLDVYILSDEDYLTPGTYPIEAVLRDSLRSSLIRYPDPDEYGDTIETLIAGGEIQMDSLDGHQRYLFRLVTERGDSVSGYYHGGAVNNYSVDKTAYGHLSIDTTECTLARPTLYEWGSLLDQNTSFYEMVFYSADSRFTDRGKQRNGVHFVVGFMTRKGQPIMAGTYGITESYSEVPSVIYGHRLGNVAWGTYWQIIANSSVMQRANVMNGDVEVVDVTENYIEMNLVFTDQLNNKVIAGYKGPVKKETVK